MLKQIITCLDRFYDKTLESNSFRIRKRTGTINEKIEKKYSYLTNHKR